jgi:spore germination cell wall hydrolase CwlJ-like protein
MSKEALIRAGLVVLLCLLFCILMWNTEPTRNESTAPAPQPKPTTITTAPTPTTTEPARGPYYALTEYERDLVERVVMAEAGAEPYKGQMAVAQCILNTCQLRQMFPAQVVKSYKYTKARPDPTESVKQAVSAVFDDGATVFSRDVLYFYAPARTTSSWHESQEYVMTIGGHRFFKEAR